jgi:uridylate kinase
MDASAVSLSRENRIPIIVFSIHDRGALSAVLCGGGRATVIEERASAD